MKVFFGRSCWASALEAAKAGCAHMDDDDHRRLAVRLANCQLGKSGLPTYECRADMPVAECTRGMDDKAWTSYSTFFTHAAAMCFYIEHGNVQERTEQLINELLKSSSSLDEGLKSLGTGVAASLERAKELVAQQRDVAARVAEVSETQSAVAALAAETRTQQEALKNGQKALHKQVETSGSRLAEVASDVGALGASMKASLDNEEKLLKVQSQTNTTLHALAVQQAAAAEGVLAKLAEIERGAAELEEAHARFQETQLAIAAAQDGLFDALDTVTQLQRRSATGIAMLLGGQYTLDDAVWYGAGGALSIAATSFPLTRGARPHALSLMAGSVLAERFALPRLASLDLLPAQLTPSLLSDGTSRLAEHYGVPIGVAPTLAVGHLDGKRTVRQIFAVVTFLVVLRHALMTRKQAVAEEQRALEGIRLQRTVSERVRELEAMTRRLSDNFDTQVASTVRQELEHMFGPGPLPPAATSPVQALQGASPRSLPTTAPVQPASGSAPTVERPSSPAPAPPAGLSIPSPTQVVRRAAVAAPPAEEQDDEPTPTDEEPAASPAPRRAAAKGKKRRGSEVDPPREPAPEPRRRSSRARA